MQASAIVKVTLKVYLTQPWSNKATVEEVIRQATHSAKIRVAHVIEQASDISLAGEPVVKIIYQDAEGA
jgi:hypothetical protein